jgi:hypothetical protein
VNAQVWPVEWLLRVRNIPAYRKQTATHLGDQFRNVRSLPYSGCVIALRGAK